MKWEKWKQLKNPSAAISQVVTHVFFLREFQQILVHASLELWNIQGGGEKGNVMGVSQQVDGEKG